MSSKYRMNFKRCARLFKKSKSNSRVSGHQTIKHHRWVVERPWRIRLASKTSESKRASAHATCSCLQNTRTEQVTRSEKISTPKRLRNQKVSEAPIETTKSERRQWTQEVTCLRCVILMRDRAESAPSPHHSQLWPYHHQANKQASNARSEL